MNGIRSLNAGAYANLPQQDIRLSGDHRGTYTQRRRDQMAGGGISDLKNIQGKDHMLAYITPGEANSLQNMGGQKVMTPEGIPAYPPPGERGGGGYTGSSSGAPPGEHGGSGPTHYEQRTLATAPMAPTTPVSDYSTQDLEEQMAIDLGEPTAQFTPEERDQQGYGTPTITDYEGEAYGTPDTMKGPIYDPGDDLETKAEKDLEWALKFGILEKDPITREIGEGPNIRDLDTGVIGPKPEPTITQGGEGEGPIVTDTTSTVPVDTGLTVDENAAAVADLDYGATFPTEFQDVPFPEYGESAFKPTVTAPEISFASRGGRVPAAYGGIMGQDGRRQYGLGSIFKSITKPIKKIAKSKLGKLALAAAAAYYGPKFLGAGEAGFGKWKDIGWLQKGLLKGGETEWSMANISPWKATAAIAGLSAAVAKPPNWDEMDQAEQEAWLAKYKSDVASYKEQYGGEMPVGLTPAADLPHQFSAEGGRIGLKGGRSVREAALRQLYNLNDDENEGIFSLAKGGRIGYQGGGIGVSSGPNFNPLGVSSGPNFNPLGTSGTPSSALMDKYAAYYEPLFQNPQGMYGMYKDDWQYPLGKDLDYYKDLENEQLKQTLNAQFLMGDRWDEAVGPKRLESDTFFRYSPETAKTHSMNQYMPAGGSADVYYALNKQLEDLEGIVGTEKIKPYKKELYNRLQSYHDLYKPEYLRGARESDEFSAIYGPRPTSLGVSDDANVLGVSDDANVLGVSDDANVLGVSDDANVLGVSDDARGLGVSDDARGLGVSSGPNFNPLGVSPTRLQRMQAARAKGLDPRMGRSYQENIQAMADPRMRGLAARPMAGPIAMAARGGRIGAQEGGLMNLGGMEKDYRQEGGFVPIGGKEKADDVPARLSKNEFVFTADAVRAAGGGDIDAGAEVMEKVMENLEAGGQISEDSQGLEGARDMFANAQQLEKRII